MNYYAYINSDNVVTGVYVFPTPVPMDGYISITEDQYTNGDLVGKVYDPETNTFSALPEWICSSDEVRYKNTNTAISDKLDEMEEAITEAAETGGVDAYTKTESDTRYSAAGHNHNTAYSAINHNHNDVYAPISHTHSQYATAEAMTTALSGKANTSHTHSEYATTSAMATALEDKADADHTHTEYATTTAVTSALNGKADTDHTHTEYATNTAVTTALSGKADATHTHTQYAGISHTHSAADLSGVVKTINNTTPDSNGNIALETSSGMTATEMLTAIKTVDGADSGLDADTLDGVQASGFATADHTHSQYATTTAMETALSGKANSNHTHSNYATVSDLETLETTVAGKADNTHTHSQYATTTAVNTALENKADVSHTHSQYATDEELTALATTVDGKANATHTHSGYASTSDITTLQTAIDGKAAVNHSHTEYAAVNHTHSDYASVDDVETLETTVAGKANTSHTHAQSDITGLSTALADKADADHTHTDYVNVTTYTSGMNNKANSTHTHAQSDITGLSTALSGKANSSHTHTLDDISETTSKKVMTAAERTKLSGVEANANNYSHPTSHAASMITGLATVATSGSYDDLSDKPTIPTVPASLPANGGNADTVDNMHAADFATADHTHTAAEVGAAAASHTHSQYVTFDDVYPVGSIYLSISNTNPSTLFGGTWVAFGEGRNLVGVEGNGTSEATGGSLTATIPAHTHTTQGHALTIAEMPTHHHELLNYNVNGYTTDTFTNNSVEGLTKKGYCGNVMTSYTGGNGSHSHGNTGSAGGGTINIAPPYITCYMWKRTN